MTSIFSGRSRTAVAAFVLGLGAALSFAGQALADPKVLAKVDGQPIQKIRRGLPLQGLGRCLGNWLRPERQDIVIITLLLTSAGRNPLFP